MRSAAASVASLVTLPKKTRMTGDNRRRQLLRAAIECFARCGFSGTKTKDIATAAGVSEAILFRHFATKEDLYQAILDLKVDPAKARVLHQHLEDCARLRDDAGLFRAVAQEILRSFQEDPAFHRLILYSFLEGHLMASLFYKRFGSPRREFLERYVALRQKEGAFRKCDPYLAVAFAVGIAVHLAMTWHLFGLRRPAISDESVVEQIVSLVLTGLEKPMKQRGGAER
jgi:AcrR family transcriptional regulator